MTTRRFLPLLVLLLVALVPTGVVQASGGDAVTAKKKPPMCKVGNNKKKCRCPKGFKVKKTRKGYKCAKKQAPKPPTRDENPDTGEGDAQDPGTTDPGTTDPGTTDPGTTDPGTTDPGAGAPEGGVPNGGTGTGTGAQPVRDDQALLTALQGAAFHKVYNGGAGFGSYTYNFLTDVVGQENGITAYSLKYCSYYYATGFTASRDYYSGLWAVKEGFTRPDYPQYPGLVTGVIYLFRQGMPTNEVVEAAVGVYGNNASINVGTGSKYFEGGDYSYKSGQATTNCGQWEPAR